MSERTDTGLYFDAEARAMRKRDRELIPRRLVIAMFSLAIAAVLLVSFAVTTERPLVGQPKDAPIFSQRQIILILTLFWCMFGKRSESTFKLLKNTFPQPKSRLKFRCLNGWKECFIIFKIQTRTILSFSITEFMKI